MKAQTYESIERRMKIRQTVFRGVLLVLLVVVCIAISWFITDMGYDPIEHEGSLTPRQSVPALHELPLAPRA